MAVWSVVLLAVSLVFLAHKHPEKMQRILPQWLWQQSNSKDTQDGSQEAPHIQIATEEGSEAETTPKASASKANGAVPTFSLSENVYGEETAAAVNPPAPSFPSPNSAQRASRMPPPPIPATASQQKPASTLMPPPARPVPASKGPAPTQAASLRVPTTAPLPNRGPPANSQQRVFNSLAPTATVQTSTSRGKVLLKPGHSPMDWAALTRSPSSTLSGVTTFQRVTPSQLRQMNGRKGKPAWSSWQGKVYNITPYVDYHPGGGPEIMKAAGRDGEKLFMETHPWVNWENMLGTCLVGVMVPEHYHDAKQENAESELEGLD